MESEHCIGVGLDWRGFMYVCMLFYLCSWRVAESMGGDKGNVRNGWQLLLIFWRS